LIGATFPSDNVDNAPYPYYDRWGDDWNVSTEGSTTDTARGFASVVWLAAQTPLANQSWKSTNAAIIAPSAPIGAGQPVTVSLQVADTNFSTARIIWEADGQEPSFGGPNYTFSPGTQTGNHWIEAEIQWPDGRRAFASNSVTVSTDAPPFLSQLQKVVGGGFTFTLTGTPMATYVIQTSADLLTWNSFATNTSPANGVLTITDPQANSVSRRYYRAMKSL
jgi:hypothetical protein